MPEEIQNKLIEEEMKESYIDYAMSVIMSRALPDVRDGLKPVHRRILYAMHQMGVFHNKAFKKCARIVGEVLGKYHPHGDTAVYDSLVRMAQEFSLRYPLIKGQGNFGSVDGDRAAAMRYTESKLSKIASELLRDIEKKTVKFVDNFDGSLEEPVVLPTVLPNLLLNGSSGIAVGMATNIPPHNLNEIADATIILIDNPETEVEELMQYVKAPDFPTGAIVCGLSGVKNAYKKGRGKVLLRAVADVQDGRIIVTELPYQVNKALLLESIANLVRDKRIEGIRDLRDESDKRGMRVVIELKKDVNGEVILNQLYKHSALQTSFGIIMLALVDGQPKILNLKDMIIHFIKHRKEVVIKRTQFDLEKAERRAHILQGLRIALMNIDAVVKMIKGSRDPTMAKQLLMQNFRLTEIQSQAILDMKLSTLTGLEMHKIEEEFRELLKLIEELKSILASEAKIFGIIKSELIELKQKYGDERRTRIGEEVEDVEAEDLIEDEDVVVSVTHGGYIKQIPLETYKAQRRGGTGVIGTETKEEDVVEQLFITGNKNYLLFFSNFGKVYWLNAYQLPAGGRYSKGKAIVNLLRLDEGERITAVVPVKEFLDGEYLLFATKKGLVKKSSLMDYSRPRKGGIIAINLKEGDEVVQVRLTPGNLNMVLGTKNGNAVKFDERDAREMGRNASGVRGVKLGKDDSVVGMEVGLETGTLLTVTENGYGKRSPISDYRLIKRGGKGVINIKCSGRNGKVVGIKTVKDDDEVMMMSQQGVVIRCLAKDISVIGRNTQGVRVMKLREGDKVTSVARVIKSED